MLFGNPERYLSACELQEMDAGSMRLGKVTPHSPLQQAFDAHIIDRRSAPLTILVFWHQSPLLEYPIDDLSFGRVTAYGFAEQHADP